MKNLALFILLLVGLSTKSFSQIDVLREGLKTVDKLNQELLNITALTDEEENEIGVGIDKQISKDYQITTSNKWNLADAFKKIKNKVSRKKIQYSFKVVKDKEVNAFAVAGGKTYFNTGLLDFVKSENELAFVIAHEIAHNEKKHCIKGIQYHVRAAQIDPTIGEVVGIAYGVYSRPFSQDQEYEADELGVRLMEKAGYIRQGAIDFFTRLIEYQKQQGYDENDALNDFIGTHPKTTKRLERIRSLR